MGWQHSVTASCNLAQPWREAYLKAMGLEYWEIYSNQKEEEEEATTGRHLPSTSPFRLMNLVELSGARPLSPEDRDDGFHDENYHDHDDDDDDPWMDTARQMYENILHMVHWIRSKRSHYTSLYMPEAEASLIQSTVTSFVATTTQEIESLRQLLSSPPPPPPPQVSSQYQQHQQALLQMFLALLKEMIAEPFGKMQKKRKRQAVQIWQHPLACHLVSPDEDKSSLRRRGGAADPLESLLENDSQEKAVDIRFRPQLPILRLQKNFLEAYREEASLSPPTLQILAPPKRTTSPHPAPPGSRPPATRPIPTKSPVTSQPPPPKRQAQHARPIQYEFDHNEEDHDDTALQELQREAILLNAPQHDLDAVTRTEQMMVEITTLLSQFADLVAEQQEHVWEIHDATVSAKDHVAQGQENLLEAKERTQKSQHYMASIIAIMALVLLVFNAIKS